MIKLSRAEKELLSKINSRIGSIKTAKKAKASRRNGKLGGRPKSK